MQTNMNISLQWKLTEHSSMVHTTTATSTFEFLFDWSIFSPLQVRPDPQRYPKEELLEIAGARFLQARYLPVTQPTVL